MRMLIVIGLLAAGCRDSDRHCRGAKDRARAAWSAQHDARVEVLRARLAESAARDGEAAELYTVSAEASQALADARGLCSSVVTAVEGRTKLDMLSIGVTDMRARVGHVLESASVDAALRGRFAALESAFEQDTTGSGKRLRVFACGMSEVLADAEPVVSDAVSKRVREIEERERKDAEIFATRKRELDAEIAALAGAIERLATEGKPADERSLWRGREADPLVRASADAERALHAACD